MHSGSGMSHPAYQAPKRPSGLDAADPLSEALGAAQGVIHDAFAPMLRLIQGGEPAKAMLQGRLCCCANDEGDRRFETHDSAMVCSVVGEDSIGHAVFPTIFKQREGNSRPLSPTSMRSSTGTLLGSSPLSPKTDGAASRGGARSGSGGSQKGGAFGGAGGHGGRRNSGGGGGVQWAPGGAVASILADARRRRGSESGAGLGLGGGAGEDCDAHDEGAFLEERAEIEIGGGARYRGQWLGDERHGHGLLIGPDGQSYEGEFADSMAHGRGVLIEADGSRYEGQWFQDMKHGHGIYIHADGTVYDGLWAEDCKSGTGTERWADGAEYQGEFCAGFKHGIGVYRGNGVEYEGQFENDKMHGEGCYKFVGGRKYFGNWDQGHMSGAGRMEWPNGTVYEGGYLNDLKHGVGLIVFPDRRRYNGEWANGKQHGNGISDDGEGRLTQERWDRGELVSSETLPSGSSIEDSWRQH